MEEEKSFFKKLKEGLSKTRSGFVSSLDNLFKASEIDDDFYDELEEILITGDVGVSTTEELIENLKKDVRENHIKEASKCREYLINNIKEIMKIPDDAYDFLNKKTIIMVVGVNGVGKTTTVGKLSKRIKEHNKKVMVAAADTFRAAANAQLTEWSERASVPMVSSVEGTDPASVVFDAVTSFKAKNMDTLIVDTAGRLHNKKNLMEELKKMNKVVDRECPDCHRETWVVLDGSTGQNALNQAKEFASVTDLNGIVLTKMDGTAKGGITIAICNDLNIPVKYIGVGEGIDDLQMFNPDDFIDALFSLKEE